VEAFGRLGNLAKFDYNAVEGEPSPFPADGMTLVESFDHPMIKVFIETALYLCKTPMLAELLYAQGLAQHW